jgi:hypothetical protein
MAAASTVIRMSAAHRIRTIDEIVGAAKGALTMSLNYSKNKKQMCVPFLQHFVYTSTSINKDPIMSIKPMVQSHEFYEKISPLFGSLPPHITKMSIYLDFASVLPVVIKAEFFCDIAENGDFISDKQETAFFKLVREE